MRAYEYLIELGKGTAPAADRSVLDEAAQLLARARSEPVPLEGERAALRSRLSMEYVRLYRATGLLEDLDAGIALCRTLIGSRPDAETHPATEAFKDLSNLAVALLTRFARTGDPGDLDEAIGLGQAALDALPPDHGDRAALLVNLASALGRRSKRPGRSADLTQAVELARTSLDAAPLASPYRAHILAILSGLLFDQYQREDEVSLLTVAVDTLRSALDLMTPMAAGYAGHVANLGVMLRARHARLGDKTALDEAIEIFQALSEAQDPESLDFASAATNLSGLLHIRSGLGESGSDLDGAALWATRAVDVWPPDHPERAAALVNLAAVLHTTEQVTGDPAPGQEAIERLKEALLLPLPDARRAEVFANLATALSRRRSKADLDQAVGAARTALRLTLANHADHVRRLADLASIYRMRFEATGIMRDLNRAVRLDRRVVASTRSGDPALSRRLSQLSLALLRSHGGNGNEADLTEAVELSRKAVTSHHGRDSLRARLLANLGNALRIRFEHGRELADLGEAVTLLREAIALSPAAGPVRARRCASLGALLLRRFEAESSAADIGEAVTMGYEAARLVSEGSSDLPMYLADLALACFRRYESAGSAADLDAAISLGRACLARTPEGHPNLPGFRSNLVAPLLARYDTGGDEATLAEALALGRAAATANTSGDLRVGVLFNLGTALARHYDRTNGAETLSEALATFDQCVRLTTAPPLYRAAAARWSGRLAAAAGEWALADAAFGSAVELLPVVADRTLRMNSAQAQLSPFEGLASDAAAVALERGDPDRALTILERARGILLGHNLGLRAELGRLKERHPEEAREFDRLRHVLSEGMVALPSAGNQLADSVPGDLVASRKRAFSEWNALLRRIREDPEFSGFLDPAADVLAPVSPGEAVVTVNVSQFRCDALVVTSAGVRPLPLPGLTSDGAIDLANELLAAIRANDWDTNARLATVLEGLWDLITEPVLEAIPAVTRLWWVPTGPLALLPLHAAGRHREGAGRTVLDRVVSSYTATMRALRHASRRSAHSSRSPLCVGVTAVPGQPKIPRAVEETRFAAACLGPAATVLIEGQATIANVTEALGSCTVAHFACHATVDPADPSSSCLHLHDGALRVRDLTALGVAGAHLAYLSSCTNAVTGTRIMDESIHLASAFQLGGFAHVIGTLWNVGDEDAEIVTKYVYPHLMSKWESPAHALHAAIQEIRAEYPHHPVAWAGYIHTGP